MKQLKIWWYKYCFRLAAKKIRRIVVDFYPQLSVDQVLTLEHLAKEFDMLGRV